MLSFQLFLQLSDFVIELAYLGSLFVFYRIDLTHKIVSKVVEGTCTDKYHAHGR